MIKLKKYGFSLLEMVIVVVIIGVLLAAIMNMSSSVSTSKVTSIITNIPKFKTAVDKEMTNLNVFSYKILKEKLKKQNLKLKKVILNSFFNGVDIKNPYGNGYNIEITSSNQLKISTKLPPKECHNLFQIIKNKNISAKFGCTKSGEFYVYYTDGN